MSSSSSSQPWKFHVPGEVMKKILSHLPLSALASFRAVSTSFLFSMLSLPATLPFPREPFFFLFYSWANRGYMVYHPLRDRWFFYSGPSFPTASSGSHFLITTLSLYEPGMDPNQGLVSVFSLFNPFSRVTTTIPLPLRSTKRYHGLVLLFNHSSAFQILASSVDPYNFDIYDSQTGLWSSCCQFPWVLDYNVNAVFLDGSLYVMSQVPPAVLRVDVAAGYTWASTPGIPITTCRHMMVFAGRLFITGWAIREGFGSATLSIEVWELTRGEPQEWKWVTSMPDAFLEEFAPVVDLLYYRASSGAGIICFYHSDSDRLMTYDVSCGRWNRASTCPMFRDQRDVWVGCAVEPNADVLR